MKMKMRMRMGECKNKLLMAEFLFLLLSVVQSVFYCENHRKCWLKGWKEFIKSFIKTSQTFSRFFYKLLTPKPNTKICQFY